MNKTVLKILAFLNAVLISIPFFFIVYQFLFPALYFLGLSFISSKDDICFFYGYWALELILAMIIAKFLYKLFNERKKIYVLILTPCTITIFIIFGISVFPHYSEFPAQSTQDIVKEESLRVTNAIANSTNKHPPPPFYYSEKLSIERAFKGYHDTISDKNYSSDNNIYELFFETPDETLISISVDTILYNNTFNKLFVTIVYEAEPHKYSGHGFIGYRLPENDSAIKLYPLEIALFPYSEEKDDLIRSLRTSYFIDIRNGDEYRYSPLDSNFWTGPLFTRHPASDSLYPFETARDFDKNTKTKPCPYILISSKH